MKTRVSLKYFVTNCRLFWKISQKLICYLITRYGSGWETHPLTLITNLCLHISFIKFLFDVVITERIWNPIFRHKILKHKWDGYLFVCFALVAVFVIDFVLLFFFAFLGGIFVRRSFMQSLRFRCSIINFSVTLTKESEKSNKLYNM